jgi:hypothetical protein
MVEWYFEAQGCVFALLVLMPFLLLRKKRKSTKGMPIGILGSLVICILYVLFVTF